MADLWRILARSAETGEMTRHQEMTKKHRRQQRGGGGFLKPTHRTTEPGHSEGHQDGRLYRSNLQKILFSGDSSRDSPLLWKTSASGAFRRDRLVGNLWKKCGRNDTTCRKIGHCGKFEEGRQVGHLRCELKRWTIPGGGIPEWSTGQGGKLIVLAL